MGEHHVKRGESRAFRGHAYAAVQLTDKIFNEKQWVCKRPALHNLLIYITAKRT